MPIITTLKQIGLSDKEIQLYLALLKRGPSSVRQLALESKINRGTTYDVLRSLIDQSLATYYHKETKQYFVAEDPAKLEQLIAEKTNDLNRTKTEILQIIPELQSMHSSAKEKPVAKYYEGSRGIKTILQDVLQTMAQEKKKEYYVYSSADIREHLYNDFPNFAKERVKKNIEVKTIAIGEGGKLWGLDERRWLSKKDGSPSYQIIYGDKLALFSLDSGNMPHGVIIEDAGTATTQRLIFKTIWDNLPKQ
ncbi:MAG: helix-turn-helix domain-containing protein [Patescibacteria group bacterium]